MFTDHAERVLFDLMVNNNIVSRMAHKSAGANHDDEESNLTQVNVKLSVGDRVWVNNQYIAYGVIPLSHTFFTGALLYSTN